MTSHPKWKSALIYQTKSSSKSTILHVLRLVTHKHHVSGTLRMNPPFFWNIAPRHWMTMSDVSGQRYGTIFKGRLSNKN